MKIVYVSTHLVMLICIISILYMSPKPDKTIQDHDKSSVTNRLYIRGLKLVEIIATTGYRVAASILISYLK